MPHYTQIVFVRPGKEEVFRRFEDEVLPLLKKYDGRLLLRWRRTDGGCIEETIGKPYEVQLIEFGSVDDFDNYTNDQTRLSLLHLKEESVERTILLRGTVA